MRLDIRTSKRPFVFFLFSMVSALLVRACVLDVDFYACPAHLDASMYVRFPCLYVVFCWPDMFCSRAYGGLIIEVAHVQVEVVPR